MGPSFLLELANAVNAERHGFPNAVRPRDWQPRISLGLEHHLDIASDARITFSDRISATRPQGDAAGFDEVFQNDLREAYLTFQSSGDQVIQAGRVNVRNGVALGFSPTDYFRTGSALVQTSADPASVRAGRLGAVLFSYQRFWKGGALSVIAAPKLDDRPSFGARSSGLDPRFDFTNATNRFLVTYSPALGPLAPQASLLVRGEKLELGLSLSLPLGTAVVTYAEWSGGKRPNLVAQAMTDATAFGALGAEAQNKFLNDAVIGASWSHASAKLTINAEYQFHQGGLGRRAWRHYFDLAEVGTPSALDIVSRIGAVANFEQDPLSRRQMFAMITRQDAGINDLTLSALGTVNLYDGSVGGQISANYARSPQWNAGLYLSFTEGARKSQYGGLPVPVSAAVSIVRYF